MGVCLCPAPPPQGTHQHLPAGHEVGTLADTFKDALQLGAQEVVVLGDSGWRMGEAMVEGAPSPAPLQSIWMPWVGRGGVGGRSGPRGEGPAVPWMLSIWPIFRAAPLTVHKVCTIRSALASDRKRLEPGREPPLGRREEKGIGIAANSPAFFLSLVLLWFWGHTKATPCSVLRGCSQRCWGDHVGQPQPQHTLTPPHTWGERLPNPKPCKPLEKQL